MNASLVLRTQFSCAHFYKVDSWSEEQNREQFGKCFTEFGHGHDYVLETSWTLESEDRVRGVLSVLRDTLDHQHLNFAIHEFQIKVPTTENLALFCLSFLSKRGEKPNHLRLFERNNLWVEVWPQNGPCT